MYDGVCAAALLQIDALVEAVTVMKENQDKLLAQVADLKAQLESVQRK